MRLLVPLATVLLVGVVARNLPQHHKAHKRYADRVNDDAVRALQDEELQAWEEDQRVRRQLASTDMAAEEKMRLAEEHWQKYSMQRRRGGCKGRYRPAPPGQIRRRCPPRARTPHDTATSSNQQYPVSGYSYPYENDFDSAAREAERLEHEARLRQYEAEKAAADAERAAYEERYRAAELRRAEEEERYRLALEERQREEEEHARNRAEEERRHYELNDQRQREYEEILRRHREQHENETARRRAPCPALRNDVLDGKSYEQIFLFAHKSGCSEEETRMAIDMARRQRIEMFAQKYVYPVLFFSRTRGWIKINNEHERLRFEEQEADLDFERLRAQYQFVKEIEAARPHPHHPPAYTEEELEHSRKLAEAEKEDSYAVIDKDNNEAVAYGGEDKPETVIDAIVLPQDVDEEDTVEEEPVPAPTQEELEEREREEQAKEEDKDALIDAVIDEMKEEVEAEKKELDEAIEKEKEEKAENADEELEKARIAEELEKELREKEEREKEEKKKEEEREREEKEKVEREEAEKAEKEKEEPTPVEKELPDEEEAVVTEEEKKEEQSKEEIKIEDPIPVIPDIGDVVIAEAPEKITEVKEEKEEEKKEEEKKEEEKKVDEKKEEVKEEKKEEEKVEKVEEGEQVGDEVILDAAPDSQAATAEEVKKVEKTDGTALEFDPQEKIWE